MMWCAIFIFAFFVIADSQPLSQEPGRIVGGRRVNIDEAPYQVSLQENGLHSCGGSLITLYHVLSAAHCFGNDTTPDILTVRLGSSISSDGGDTISVTDLYIHPGYDTKTENFDAAIVVLSRRPKTKSFPIKTIALSTQTPENWRFFFVTGWGATHEKGSQRNKYLRGVLIPKVPQGTCKKLLGRSVVLTDKMMCAGFLEGGKDSCQGDSGGPAVCDDVLVGIVSWGKGCGRKNSPGVYTDVSKILNWIERITNLPTSVNK